MGSHLAEAPGLEVEEGGLPQESGMPFVEHGGVHAGEAEKAESLKGL